MLLFVGCLSTTVTSDSLDIICFLASPSTCDIRQNITLTSDDHLQVNATNLILPDIKTFTLNDDYNYQLPNIPSIILTSFPALTKLQLNNAQIATLSNRPVVNFTFAPHLESNETSPGNESLPIALHLNRLELRNNRLSQLHADAFSWAPHLTRIDLSHNQIREMANHTFRGLLNLTELKLNDNQVRILNSDAVTGARNLEYLHLHANELETLRDGAFNLPMLIELLLRDNRLTVLSDAIFARCPAVGYIDIARNRLWRIDQAFYACDKLFSLNLEGNPIGCVDWTRLADMHSLATLSLNATNIMLPKLDGSRRGSSRCKSLLARLVLAHNALFEHDVLQRLATFEHLEVLFLNDNKLSRLSSNACEVRKLFPYLRNINVVNNVAICEWFWQNEKPFKAVGIRITAGDCGYYR